MKTFKKTTFLLFTMVFSFGTFAQLAVKEETNSFGGEMVNTLVIEIPEAGKKDVLKDFKELMKNYQGELDKDKKENMSINTLIPKISNTPLTVYFKVDEKTGGGSILTAGFKLEGKFLSYDNATPEFNGARNLIKDFAVKSGKAATTKKLEAAIKDQEKLEKEKEKIKREKEKLDKSIVDNREKIVKAENAIKEAENNLNSNAEEQKKKEAEIAAQKKVLQKIKEMLEKIR